MITVRGRLPNGTITTFVIDTSAAAQAARQGAFDRVDAFLLRQLRGVYPSAQLDDIRTLQIIWASVAPAARSAALSRAIDIISYAAQIKQAISDMTTSEADAYDPAEDRFFPS